MIPEFARPGHVRAGQEVLRYFAQPHMVLDFTEDAR